MDAHIIAKRFYSEEEVLSVIYFCELICCIFETVANDPAISF